MENFKENVEIARRNLYKQQAFLKAYELGFYEIGSSFDSDFDDKGMRRLIKPFYAGESVVVYYFDEAKNGIRVSGGISTDEGGCSNPLISKDGIFCRIYRKENIKEYTIEQLQDKLGEEFKIIK